MKCCDPCAPQTVALSGTTRIETADTRLPSPAAPGRAAAAIHKAEVIRTAVLKNLTLIIQTPTPPRLQLSSLPIIFLLVASPLPSAANLPLPLSEPLEQADSDPACRSPS